MKGKVNVRVTHVLSHVDASACIASPDAHAVSQGKVELVSGLHIECRVPGVEVAHRIYPELIGGVHGGHHLMPKVSFTRLRL